MKRPPSDNHEDHDEGVNTFGHLFATLCKQMRLTQQELAMLLAISPGTIQRWEHDVTSPDGACT
jgi:DNA-binding transcriptional regulator YiaG